MDTPLSPTGRHANLVLPPERRRRAAAEQQLGQVLEAWGLQPALAGRWLAPADSHLGTDLEITLGAEYDPELQVCTVELWQDGRRVYGIDDWVG